MSLAVTYPPNPETRRGYKTGISFSSSKKKGDKIAYCNGINVWVRDAQNLNDVEMFNEHKCKVNVAAISPNGEWCASGDSKGRVFVWAIKSKIIKLKLEVCQSVTQISWGPEGKRILAGGIGKDTFARCFMWDSGNSVGDMVVISEEVLSVDLKPNRPYRAVTTSFDKQVNFYTGPPFRFKAKNTEHSKRYPNSARFSPDGKYIVSVGGDKRVILYDAKTFELIKELTPEDKHTSSILDVCWSPDSKQFATCSMDRTVKVWDVESGTIATTFTTEGKDFNYQQNAIVWVGDAFLSLSLRGDLYWWSQGQEKPMRVISGHQNKCKAIAVDRTSGKFYTGDSAGRIMGWEMKCEAGTEIRGNGHSEKTIVDLSVNSDGTTLFSVGYDDNLFMTDSKSLEFGKSCALGSQPSAVQACPIDASVCYVLTKKNVLLGIRDGAVFLSQEFGNRRPTKLAVRPDGKELALGFDDNSVQLYTVDGDKVVEGQKLMKHKIAITAVAYSPCGKFLASGDRGRYIYLWDLSNGNVLNSGWRFHQAQIYDLSFSPNGKCMISSSLDGSMIVWKDLVEYAAKERVVLEAAHFGGCIGVDFVDDTTFVSTGSDNAVRVWNL